MRRRPALALLALAVLAACDHQPDPAPAPVEPPVTSAPDDAGIDPSAASADIPQGSTPILNPDVLVGEYRVSAIDGGEVEGTQGIALSIAPGTMSYEPRCLGFAWTWRMTGGALHLARDPAFGPQPAQEGSAIVSCTVLVPPSFGPLGTALDAVERAARTPSNGVVLFGGGRSVTLFSQ